MTIALFDSSRKRFCPEVSIVVKSRTQTLKGFQAAFSFVLTVSVMTVVVVVVVVVVYFSVDAYAA